ncbi:MAG TPA: hypothetical protein VN726_08035 [Hanamia sp.]|nr:hypothetical protein [Hanamia sp.]
MLQIWQACQYECLAGSILPKHPNRYFSAFFHWFYKVKDRVSMGNARLTPELISLCQGVSMALL